MMPNSEERIPGKPSTNAQDASLLRRQRTVFFVSPALFSARPCAGRTWATISLQGPTPAVSCDHLELISGISGSVAQLRRLSAVSHQAMISWGRSSPPKVGHCSLSMPRAHWTALCGSDRFDSSLRDSGDLFVYGLCMLCCGCETLTKSHGQWHKVVLASAEVKKMCVEIGERNGTLTFMPLSWSILGIHMSVLSSLFLASWAFLSIWSLHKVATFLYRPLLYFFFFFFC